MHLSLKSLLLLFNLALILQNTGAVPLGGATNLQNQFSKSTPSLPTSNVRPWKALWDKRNRGNQHHQSNPQIDSEDSPLDDESDLTGEYINYDEEISRLPGNPMKWLNALRNRLEGNGSKNSKNKPEKKKNRFHTTLQKPHTLEPGLNDADLDFGFPPGLKYHDSLEGHYPQSKQGPKRKNKRIGFLPNLSPFPRRRADRDNDGNIFEDEQTSLSSQTPQTSPKTRRNLFKTRSKAQKNLKYESDGEELESDDYGELTEEEELLD
ncbi:hypothetical protein HMI54_004336 [Coelomomyces lativittatus]|nr:hypothetical protein HMI54_004336 [Coelomomyces lativittatus]KAJ1512599.1 hypothetical protein HMI56_003840 [Coelomomyces lativittatus]KAJ1515826.1 hypothetical protein HMI55_003318 [Coelomomyces lativittatus]